MILCCAKSSVLCPLRLQISSSAFTTCILPDLVPVPYLYPGFLESVLCSTKSGWLQIFRSKSMP